MNTETSTPTVQTTFRNLAHSDAVAARIQGEADKLNKYFDRITSCRVMVEVPHRHHRHGDAFHIRIELAVPRRELVVAHEPSLHNGKRGKEENSRNKGADAGAPHQDVYVAIRDAFSAMRRQLQDYARDLRE